MPAQTAIEESVLPHVQLSPFCFDCSLCHTRCDGISKGVYVFEHDTSFSERYEREIIAIVNASRHFKAAKCEEPGYPDIVVHDLHGNIKTYLEVKVQQRTFMSVQKHLPASALLPSETVALNLSDLRRYFDIQEKTKVSTSIVWLLLNRPCILQEEKGLYFFQTIDNLKKIYCEVKDKRRFRRKSGDGDIVDGQHKGVTVNYHFSLKELLPWKPRVGNEG